MKLYRIGGDFKKVEISYRLDQVAGSRLDVGLTDQYSLNRLTRLVNGGLRHINDLYAIEMALKAIIFHESIQSITPSAKIQILQESGAEPFFTSLTPDADDTSVLQDVFNQSGFGVQLCGVDQLIGFSDDTLADAYILHHETSRIAKIKEENDKFFKLGIPEPSFSLNPSLVPIEYVAENKAEFFERVFTQDDSILQRFLKPASISGHAIYIGDPLSRAKLSPIRNFNAEQFFGTLDKDWQEHYSYLNRALNIPIPLFLTIILNRASGREDIPNQILLLRQEFAEARRQLWDLFDEADFRIFDTKVSVRVLKDIEQAAAKVIPKWKKSNELWFPINFEILGRALKLDALGLVKDLGGFLRDSVAKECYSVDAAKLLQKQLETVELRGLIERHISEQEINMLSDSVDKWS